MYRPALVIGIGGTGVLTLRHLKAQLQASKEHSLPSQVKLIALDTVKEEKQSAQTSGDTQIAALRTELKTGEYYWIGGDVHDFVRQINRDFNQPEKEYPHISSWFQAPVYLESLPHAAFTLERGAGQLRQFGRLAVFYDVSAPARSAIYNLLNRAIGEIRKEGHFQTIDVFLVTSVAGGTGAGMFVDIAYLVRQVAQIDQQLAIRLRGFLVLPEAFSAIPGGIKPDMRARAYACMRENKRFMVDFQYEHGYPMRYHASGQGGIWCSAIKTKLFDFLYHVDGQSQRTPLTNYLPEYGVTAVISDAIAAMLDKPREQEEDVYDRHTANVITQASQMGLSIGDAGTTSFDSAVGSFSLILPIHHIANWLAHRLSLEALEIFLAPSKKDEDGFPIALNDAANAEFPGVKGRDVSPRFLQTAEAQSLKSGERVASTPFFQEIARIALNYRPNDSTMARELGSREARDWEMHLDPPGTTTEIVTIRQQVQQALNSRLLDEVPHSQRGESDGSALDRVLRGVETYRGYYLGREDLRTGQLVGGQYRSSLKKYTHIQQERYRLLLQMECENILNGGQNPDDPASIQRGGKLGYLLDWLAGLEEIFGRFLRALNEAKDIRESRGEKQVAVASAHTARQDLEDKPGGGFLGIGGGKSRRKDYLEAEQRVVDLEKTLIVEDLVRGTVESMLQHTRQLHESAQKWTQTLGIGYDSLYARLLRGERQIRDAISAEQKVPVREYVWDQDYLDDLYTKYAQELSGGVDDFLGQITWLHEQRRSGVKEIYGFRLFVQTSEDEEQNLLGMENQDRNLKLVLTPARQVFAAAWEQESILKYLMNRKYKDANALAEKLAKKTDVLLSAEGKSVVPANYLHVAHGTDPAERTYLDTVSRRLESETQARGKLNDIVNSADRFALRLVHTLDLIPLERVDSYRKAQTDYWTYAGEVQDKRGVRGQLGRGALHLFPAEVNAARLETSIPRRLKMKDRVLHNDIVLQLEDMDRFRLFVRCKAFGLINRDRQEGIGGGYQNFWCLDLPAEETGSVRGPDPALKIYLTRPATGDPDVVEAMKVWNYERRDIRGDINVPILYERVRRAVHTARDQEIQKRKQNKQDVDEATVRERVEMLPQTDREPFKCLWLERRHLQEVQQELKKEIERAEEGILAQDAAIAQFMVLDEDIHSLNLAMDDLLKGVGSG